MDAAVFMRFTTMCRDIFVILAVLGCAVLVPVNLNNSVRFTDDVWITRLGPTNVWGNAQWAQVVVAWLFNLVVCGFLWWNYRKVLRLRRAYFESEEDQTSLHARTLMASRVTPTSPPPRTGRLGWTPLTCRSCTTYRRS